MLQLKETNHSYYCSESNYYVGDMQGENHGLAKCDTWLDFKETWLGGGEDGLGIDIDYNLCFRFDIKKKHDDEDEEIEGVFELWLFFMQQRKGNYVPVYIKNITDQDMAEINIFLKRQWDYMKGQWSEFSEAEG